MAVPASEWATRRPVRRPGGGGCPRPRGRLLGGISGASSGRCSPVSGPARRSSGRRRTPVPRPWPPSRATTTCCTSTTTRSTPLYSTPSAPVPCAGPAPNPRGARPLLSNVCDGCFGARPADLAVDPTPGPRAHRRRLRPPGLCGAGGSRRSDEPSCTAARPRPVRGEADPGPEGGPLSVLVVMGGTDPQACAPLVVDALAGTGLDLDVTAIATPATEAGLPRRKDRGRPAG